MPMAVGDGNGPREGYGRVPPSGCWDKGYTRVGGYSVSFKHVSYGVASDVLCDVADSVVRDVIHDFVNAF